MTVQPSVRPTPDPVFAWLIERGQAESHEPTMWWVADHEWTTDATRAAWFATEAEADEVIRREISAHISRPTARAVEHGFIGKAQ